MQNTSRLSFSKVARKILVGGEGGERGRGEGRGGKGQGGGGEGENEDNVLLHERLTIDDSLALQHLVINQFLSSSDKYSPVHGHGELERERERERPASLNITSLTSQ